MKQFAQNLTVFVLFTLLSLAGCSDSPTLVNPDSGSTNTSTPYDEITSITEGVAQSGTTVYSTTVGSAGGTLDGPDADFNVTENALSTSTTITMTVDDALPNEVVMGPSGQQFAETCLLLMDKPSGYSSQDDYTIFWWDAANSNWVDLDAGDLGPVVVANIDHFSTFRTGLVE